MRHHDAVACVDADTDARPKQVYKVFQQLRRLRCDRSQHHPHNTRVAKFFYIRKRSNATTKLDPDIDFFNDLLRHFAIRREGLAKRAVEIDNMNHLSTRSCKLPRDCERVLVVNSHVRLASLRQSHAATVSEIDCGNYDHAMSFITSSNNNPFVAIALPPLAVLTPRQSVNVPP